MAKATGGRALLCSWLLVLAANALAQPDDREHQAGEPSWSELGQRLLLVEEILGATNTKLHETEERIRALERCDCRQSCSWSPTGSGPTQLKADGESWTEECDVCSCHRGQVHCRHVSCPPLNCSTPHHVVGKCCPICYRSCAYKQETVSHGNKLVIKSAQETCKECVCLDGRFKCQRVEPLRDASQPRAPRHAQPDDQDEEPLELDADWLEEPDREVGVRARRSPLVCPPVECPAERQVRLANDCCTYCMETDFCALPGARSSCHPNANCANRPLVDTHLSALDSTISCTCKSGFDGDGRLCRDIDECQARPCDTDTSSCLNTPGGFRCDCRPGFERPAGAAPTSPCVDVDECGRPEVSGCSPNARCINLLGSFRCQCRRGFLGNGFECHKWFSSAPQVAAYLHAHKPARATDNTSTPVEPLDEARIVLADYELQPNHVDEPLPVASNSLKLSQQGSDSAGYASNNQPTPSANSASSAPAASGSHLDNNKDRRQLITDQQSGKLSQPQQANEPPANSWSAPDLPEPSALNTRTMFFQPPPKPKKPQPPDNGTLHNNQQQQQQQLALAHHEQTVHATDSGQELAQGRPFSSSSTLGVAPDLLPHAGSGRLSLADSASNDANRSANASLAHPRGQVYKKGTIIASATTSQISKSRTMNNLGVSPSRQQHKSRALGVTSTSSSSSGLPEPDYLSTLLAILTIQIFLCTQIPSHFGTYFLTGNIG